MEAIALKRTFSFKKGTETITLPDPNPAFTPQQIIQFHATQHPELTTSTISGPKISGEALEYEFVTTIGTKG